VFAVLELVRAVIFKWMPVHDDFGGDGFIADVNEMEKRYEQAVQLLAAAETLRIQIGAPIEQINQKANEDALTRLRAQLGDVVFEFAWAKGATMSTKQAIELALS
jgi:hypothetical protein